MVMDPAEHAPQPGDPAPPVTLPAVNHPEGTFSLEEAVAEGPVVLAFFPLAFTSTCTTELCTFRDDLAAYDALSAQVVGVSCDARPSLRVFAREQGYTFPLLSDWNRTVVPRYGGFHETLVGLREVPRRAVFVVDGGMRVAYAWVTTDADDLPPFDEVKAALERLRS